MKAVALGAVIGVIVAMILNGSLPLHSAARAERFAAPLDAGDLITSTAMTADNRQLVTIIDPKTRVLAVYLVDAASGGVSLKSVRNFHWDLQLAEFNGTSPLPREIQSLVEQNIR